MLAQTVPQAQALRDPANHIFRPGTGHLRAAKPLPMGALKGTTCAADAPKDGTRHLLQPPYDHESLFATWHAASGCWLFVGGRRLGFTPDYLASHGWSYLRAAPLGKWRAPNDLTQRPHRPAR